MMSSLRLQRAEVESKRLSSRETKEEAPYTLAPPPWALSMTIAAKTPGACVAGEEESGEGEDSSWPCGARLGHR